MPLSQLPVSANQSPVPLQAVVLARAAPPAAINRPATVNHTAVTRFILTSLSL